MSLGLTPSEIKALNEIEPSLGSTLNERMAVIQAQINANRGLRGEVNRAANMDMSGNKVTKIANPVNNTDAINYGTLKRFRTCQYLAETIDQCIDMEDYVEGALETTTVLSESGYFIGYTVRMPESGTVSSIGGLKELLAWPFVLPFSIVVNSVTYEVTTGAAGRFTLIGLYNSLGVLVLNTGAVEATTGVKTVSLTGVELQPGFYTLAAIGDGVDYRIINPLSVRDAFPLWNKTATRQGTAGAQATYALPGSLPALTATTTLPLFVLFESL